MTLLFWQQKNPDLTSGRIEQLQQHANNSKVNIHLLSVLNTSQESKNSQNPRECPACLDFSLKRQKLLTNLQAHDRDDADKR